jgi:uncharacterized Zn-binding protein involved in type VI secretion
MARPAAREDDRVTAIDTHLVSTPSGPTPVQLPFDGGLKVSLSRNVLINGRPAATVGSIAKNGPRHRESASLAEQPTDEGEVVTGSLTVLVNGKGLARVGDTVKTCNYPVALPVGSIVPPGSQNVFAG